VPPVTTSPLDTPRLGTETRTDLLRRAFYAMILARALETKLSSLYKAGKIVGGVYVGRGQEAVSAALGACLRKGEDVFAPLIRDQAGRSAFGEEIITATRTYLGSVKGPMRGRDGNVHRGSPKEGIPAMISHLGSAIPVVAGALFARRLKGTLGHSVGATCLGDGGTSTGAFHEGLNLAAVEKLPFVLVVTNNQFAYSTPTSRQFACKSLVDKAIGYGVTGHEVDGTSLLHSMEVMHTAVEAARAGKGPQLVVANILRLSGHGEHDDASYVPQSLRDSPLGQDCIEVAIKDLVSKSVVTPEEVEAWLTQTAEDVQSAVAQAQQEPVPDPYQDDWRAFSTPEFSAG
jgi:TPP-dependent pyruvate/acetoin dehydrogenase alpha subunit